VSVDQIIKLHTFFMLFFVIAFWWDFITVQYVR